jgi:hypothetical protein
MFLNFLNGSTNFSSQHPNLILARVTKFKKTAAHAEKRCGSLRSLWLKLHSKSPSLLLKIQKEVEQLSKEL